MSYYDPEAARAMAEVEQEAIRQAQIEELAKQEAQKQSTQSSGSTWKPDFTKDNPYEGVPDDYLKKIEGTQAYDSAVNQGWIQPVQQPTSYKPTTTTTTQPTVTKTPTSSVSGNTLYIGDVAVELPSGTSEASKQRAADLVKKIKSRDFTDEQLKQLAMMASENPEMVNQFTRDYEKFIYTHTQLGDGSYIKNDDFKSLTTIERGIAKSKGFDGLNQYWEKRKDPKFSLPADARQVYKESTGQEKFEILKSYGAVDEKATYQGTDAKGDPIYKMGMGVESFVMSKAFSDMVVESFVPLVYTIGKWNDMSAGERVLSISLDALFFLPFLGAAGRGAKATTAVTRAERFKGAISGVGREMMMQARAPVDIVLHPIQSVKGTAKQGWDTLENIFNIKKLPEAVISTTDGTIRIPINKNISAAEAVTARNRIMQEAINTGADIVIEMNGTRYTLQRSALAKELGGSLTHATPSGEAFLDGVRVKMKPGMSLVEQGLFVSPEALPRFTKASAFGQTGETSAILITSSDTARDALQTGKIYKSKAGPVTELEMKFPTGYEVKEPTQVLYTRLGYEKYKTLLLLEKPLSKRQILKLKSLAVWEDLKAPFKPALLIENTDDYIKGASKFENIIDEEEVRRLARLLDQSGNRSAARNLRATFDGMQSVRDYQNRGIKDSRRIGNITINTSRPVKPYNEPTRETFNVYAEKVGRQKVKLPETTKSQPIRITNKKNQESRPVTPDTFTKVKAKVEDIQPRVKTKTDSTEERGIRGFEREHETGRTPRYGRRGNGEDTTRRFMPTSPEYQQKSRQEIKISGGAIAWRMGKVGKRDRWDVVVNPYTSNEHYYMILGKQPEGATILQRGKRSAYGTTQVIKGTAPKRQVKVDSGIADITITPVGKRSVKMKVTSDPKQETTGDITIGRRKFRRITPKTPKIK